MLATKHATPISVSSTTACSNSARNHSVYEVTPDGSLLSLRRSSERQPPLSASHATDSKAANKRSSLGVGAAFQVTILY
jgi:hypothetical protein